MERFPHNNIGTCSSHLHVINVRLLLKWMFTVHIVLMFCPPSLQFNVLSIIFPFRLLECYRRMAEPCLDIVDASGSPDEVLQSVLGRVRQQLPNIKV